MKPLRSPILKKTPKNMTKNNGFLRLLLVACAATSVESFGSGGNFYQITGSIRTGDNEKYHSSLGTISSSFYDDAAALEVDLNEVGDCEVGSMVEILFGKVGNCPAFEKIRTAIRIADEDVTVAAYNLFSGTLSVESTENPQFFMDLTNDSADYGISNSTNLSHMYDAYGCMIQSINEHNVNNPVTVLNASSAGFFADLSAFAVDSDTNEPLLHLIGQRSDPVCIKNRVALGVSLQNTFHTRDYSQDSALEKEELYLAILGIVMGVVFAISFVCLCLSRDAKGKIVDDEYSDDESRDAEGQNEFFDDEDAGSDASSDAGSHASSDAGSDASSDASSDAGSDSEDSDSESD